MHKTEIRIQLFCYTIKTYCIKHRTCLNEDVYLHAYNLDHFAFYLV